MTVKGVHMLWPPSDFGCFWRSAGSPPQSVFGYNHDGNHHLAIFQDSMIGGGWVMGLFSIWIPCSAIANNLVFVSVRSTLSPPSPQFV